MLYRLVPLFLLLAFASQAWGLENECHERPLALQVLGSGGPFPRDDRASSSYLVWVEGRARVMVDVGGGAFVRFGESGARIEDLSLLAVSHFHPDHVSDLPALLWVSSNFRRESLLFSGPSGDNIFPDTDTFLKRLFSDEQGAFPILSGTLGGTHSGFPLEVISIDVARPDASVVLDTPALKVSAIGVPHNAPSLGYRVQVGDVSIVFSGDQNGTDPSFVDFARDATVLVMHFAVSEASRGPVHARPSIVGQIARDAKVRKLVLSHFLGVEQTHPRFGDFSLGDLTGNVAVLQKYYTGELIQAEDLQCIAIE